jgi:hypothetical protein
MISISTEVTKGKLKIGWPNPRGWLAYWREGTLFVKPTAYHARSSYPDFGNSSGCYCNDMFLELEALGPIAEIKPGESVSHSETWQVFSNIAWSGNLGEIITVID